MMDDKRLLKAYGLGLCVLSLIENYKPIERMGKIAKIYNTIKTKHENFNKQLFEYRTNKKNSISKKCALYVEAGAIADKAWDHSKTGLDITVESTISSIYYKNKEDFKRIYGFNDDDFYFGNNIESGTLMASLRTANILSEQMDICLELHKKI